MCAIETSVPDGKHGCKSSILNEINCCDCSNSKKTISSICCFPLNEDIMLCKLTSSVSLR